MSQIVTLKRRISLEDLKTTLRENECFELGEEHDWGFTLKYLKDPSAFVNFANGQLEATSPNEDLYRDLESLAQQLLCEVVLEEEESYIIQEESALPGGVIALYWPLLVILLVGLLVWRW